MSSFRITIACLVFLLGGQAAMAWQQDPELQSVVSGNGLKSNLYGTVVPSFSNTKFARNDAQIAPAIRRWDSSTDSTSPLTRYPVSPTVAAEARPKQESSSRSQKEMNYEHAETQPVEVSVLAPQGREKRKEKLAQLMPASFSSRSTAAGKLAASTAYSEPSHPMNRYPLSQDDQGAVHSESQISVLSKKSSSQNPQHSSRTNIPQPQLAGSNSGEIAQPSLPTFQQASRPGAAYRPDPGHRNSMPMQRHYQAPDNGEQFEFENKKNEYPPMREILATGRYFGSAGILVARPHFQGNTAFLTSSATFEERIAFDFDHEAAPLIRMGFESTYGPGVEFEYLQYEEASNQASFTATNGVTAEFRTSLDAPGQFSRIAATNAGETISAEHSLDVETFGVSFFKEVQLPISRINGRFGLQYVSVFQNVDATLTDAGGVVLGTLNSRSDMRAYGPRFTFEYYRPLGHTKLEFVTSVGGSVLFGRRDQFISNSLSEDFSSVGSDEFLTSVEFSSGVQYKHNIGEKRSVYARLGGNYSTWIGGGSAVDSHGDFGLRGFSFAVGYNR